MCTDSMCVYVVCVCMQDATDQFLEDERDKILTGYVVMIQKRVRGWFLRRRFLAMRKAALVFQKNYRRHLATRNWRKVRTQEAYSQTHHTTSGTNL